MFFKGNADEWGIFVYNQATAQADAQELMVVGKHPEEQIDDDGFVFLMRERGSGTGSVENKVFCRQASSYVKIAENNTHPYDIKVHKISEITAIDEGGDVSGPSVSLSLARACSAAPLLRTRADAQVDSQLWIGDLSNVDIREVDIQITKGTTSLNSVRGVPQTPLNLRRLTHASWLQALHATGDVVIDSTLTTDGEITTDGDFTVTTSQGDIKLDGGVVAAGHTLLSSSDLGGIEACHLSGTQGRLGCVVQGDTVKVDGGLSAVTLHHVIATCKSAEHFAGALFGCPFTFITRFCATLRMLQRLSRQFLRRTPSSSPLRPETSTSAASPQVGTSRFARPAGTRRMAAASR